jgi:outer membrane protein TolC
MRMAVRFLVVIGMGLPSAPGLFAQPPNPLRGSVVRGVASPTPLSLTLDEALQRGLQFNLGLLDSETASQTAKADRIQALSLLLPQVSGTVAETREELNLTTARGRLLPLATGAQRFVLSPRASIDRYVGVGILPKGEKDLV